MYWTTLKLIAVNGLPREVNLIKNLHDRLPHMYSCQTICVWKSTCCSECSPFGKIDVCLNMLSKKHRSPCPFAGLKKTTQYRSFNIPPWAYPRAFDTFSCLGEREFDHLSLPGCTTHRGWRIWSIASISCHVSPLWPKKLEADFSFKCWWKD